MGFQFLYFAFEFVQSFKIFYVTWYHIQNRNIAQKFDCYELYPQLEQQTQIWSEVVTMICGK